MFLKPTSEFKFELEFQGNFQVATVTNNEARVVDADGNSFTIYKDMWNRTYESGQYIKVGNRCSRVTEENMQKEIRGNVKEAIQTAVQWNPDSIKSTVLSTLTIDPALYIPIKTGTFIDEFFSHRGGILPGTKTMITGEPGIGKSSVMMDILQGVVNTNPDKKVLYVSAELTEVELLDPEAFMKYYPGLLDKVEFMFASTYLEHEDGPTFTQALGVLLGRGYDIVVMDSLTEVQTLVRDDLNCSAKETETHMLNLFTMASKTAFLLIQQVNKDGQFVGSKRMVHMLTAFMLLKWCTENRGRKYMIFHKNRKGDVQRKLYFKFSANGIEYDTQKYEDELKVESIMNNSTSTLKELTDLELAELFVKRAEKNMEEVTIDEDENEEDVD